MTDEPCAPWATVEDTHQCAACDLGDLSDEIVEVGLQVASNWLYRGSGRQYPGICEVTVRPIAECGQGCCGDGRAIIGPVFGWILYSSAGGTYEWAGPGSTVGRAREGVHEVPLGFFPIREVLEVVIDGATLDPSAYRIDDNGWLVRLDGDPWPHRNDMALDTTEPGTWAVTLEYGYQPPADGVLAAQVLGVEVAKSLCGKACRLPERVQTLARQGVTLTLMDPTDLLENGRYGILAVDAFLTSSNPHGLTRDAAIINVDLMRDVRRTGTTLGS